MSHRSFLRLVAAVLFAALLVVGLFLLAGRWDWLWGWICLALLFVGSGLNDLLLWRKNPDLLARRARMGKGTKSWDIVCLGVFGTGILLILVVGALDAGRYRWCPLPGWLQPLGVVSYIVGQAVLTWSMLANPFFEKTARIQSELGHRVVDRGPYRYIRHPGYVGAILAFVIAPALMLGSGWALVPAAGAGLALVVRTALEDRMLRAELPGYRAYAARVRCRLLPGIW